MNPHHRALLRHAEALQEQGRLPEAVASYRQLLELQPDLPNCWYNLGYLLKRLGQAEAALLAYDQALQRGVQGAEEVHLNRAVIYTDLLRRDQAAQTELERALQLAPNYAPALLNLGNLHEECGRREAALDCYERMLAAAPTQDLAAEAVARIAHLRPPQDATDPLLQQLELAAAPDDLPAQTRANVLYALGRACDALGMTERAFAAFTQANAQAARTGPAYDAKHAERLTQALQQVFATASGGEVEPARVTHSTTWQPVFVCGMFRSGSTLIEQVLGMHSAVCPGGELDWFVRLVRTDLAPFPAAAAALDRARLQELAGQYLAHLEQLFTPGETLRYITDKRPDNYLLIGLIKQLFPTARFIHTVRDPRDVGLSIFMQHLDQRSLSYATRLSHIAHHQLQYQQLMKHWKRLYPQDILDVDYDVLVREPEAAMRRVLDFLGLPWEAACLDFHQQRNSVKTASYWQVRRPLYSEASGRWRRYRTHLGELLQPLRAAGLDLPD